MSYASQPSWGRGGGSTLDGGKPYPAGAVRHSPGYKPKDLIPIPWLVALALQADGWWLRSAPPWLKKNCLPESVRDRPTTAHEYWFLLSKSARYYYDAEAVRKPSNGWRGSSFTDERDHATKPNLGMGERNERPGRNRRTTDFFFESLDAAIAAQRRYLRHLERVRDDGGMLLDEDGDPLALVFNTKGWAGAHYATFPPPMIEPLVKSSTSERGVCPRCGGPWVRVVEKGLTAHSGKTACTYPQGTTANRLALLRQAAREQGAEYINQSITTDWRPTCDCAESYVCEQCNGSGGDGHSGVCLVCDGKGEVLLPPDPAPALILDPFVGSGTVPLVARALGRHGVGLDLSFDYLRDQARARLKLDAWDDWHNGGQQVEAAWEELPLFVAQQAALELGGV